MEKKIKIYYLHRGNNIPFYVGKTIKPSVRLSQHIFSFKDKNIEMVLLDKVDKSEWKFWEKYWIEQLRYWGFVLENKNNGGGGPKEGIPKPEGFGVGRTHSETTKQKISKANKGKKGPLGYVRSKKTKQKISKANSKPKPQGFSQKIKNLKQNTPNIKSRKPILQFDLEGNFIKEWDGAITIKKELGINNVSVMQCCKGIIKTSNNYIWKYKN